MSSEAQVAMGISRLKQEAQLATRIDQLKRSITAVQEAMAAVYTALHDCDVVLGETTLRVSKRKLDEFYEGEGLMWQLVLALVWETSQPDAQTILLQSARSLLTSYANGFAETQFYQSGLNPAALAARLAAPPTDTEDWISVVVDLAYLLTDVALEDREMPYMMLYDVWCALPPSMKCLPMDRGELNDGRII